MIAILEIEKINKGVENYDPFKQFTTWREMDSTIETAEGFIEYYDWLHKEGERIVGDSGKKFEIRTRICDMYVALFIER